MHTIIAVTLIIVAIIAYPLLKKSRDLKKDAKAKYEIDKRLNEMKRKDKFDVDK